MSTPWTEKAGKVVFNTPNYSWYQSIDDVVITIPVPPGTAARQIDYSIKTDRLRIGLKGQKPIIDARFDCEATLYANTNLIPLAGASFWDCCT